MRIWRSATNAKIYITHADGEAQQVVNQRASIGQWVSLGTYRFAAGGTSKIEFSNHADGMVMAGAVKLVPAVTGAQTSRWQGNVATAGDYQFFAKWPVDTTLSSNAQYTLSGGTWRWRLAIRSARYAMKHRSFIGFLRKHKPAVKRLLCAGRPQPVSNSVSQ